MHDPLNVKFQCQTVHIIFLLISSHIQRWYHTSIHSSSCFCNTEQGLALCEHQQYARLLAQNCLLRTFSKQI
jgi:hypothetical protein